MGTRKLRESFEREALGYLDSLYGLALRLTRNEGEAEDLLQDALVKAYRFYDRFEPGSNLKAWLFKVVTNTFYNRCRKRKNIQRMILDAELGDHHDRFVSSSSAAARDPEQAVLDRMAAKEIEAAIGELPEDFRLVVILCDIYEFSYREIADIIERPVGTVMSRLYRGRKLLQRKLYDYAVQQGVIKPVANEADEGADKRTESNDTDGAQPTDLAAYRKRRRGDGGTS